ncbi:MAG: TadE/TadG family type IV pilus assembly protein [Planctomycetota bacterium]
MFRKLKQQRRQRKRGVSVLETALVLPLLAALTFGIIEYGYFFYVHHSVQGAARQGARAGAVDGGTNTDVNAAIAQAMDNASLKNINYTVKIHDGSGTVTAAESASAGSSVAVEVDINWQDASLVKLGSFAYGAILPSKVHGSTVMRKEG